MKTLLVVDSSGRVTRSVTRQLTARFAAAWQRAHPGGAIVHRDVGLEPPPPVDEAWIAASFAESAPGSPALAISDAIVEEFAAADAVVVGAPMYNLGMPAALKAYIDQLVRIGRVFTFHPDAEEVYRPVLPPRPVVLITSVGDGAMLPGGALAHWNFLEPHLEAVFRFIGTTEVHVIRAGYDEFQDERWRRSLASAEAEVDALAGRLTAGTD